jgi:hypothetical protein
MKSALSLISSSLLAIASFACSGGEASDDGGNGGAATGGTGGTTATGGTGAGTGGSNACSANVVANAVNNYTFSSTLTFPPVTVKPDTELTFDWSAVTTDFLGHTFNPMTDIDTVNLMLWKLTQEQLETKLNADTLLQRDLAIIATYYTEKATTNAPMFEFTSVGMELQPCDFWPYLQLPMPDPMAHTDCEGWAENAPTGGYDPALNTYTVMIASGTELGAGTRMIQGFKLDAASTNTHVALNTSSTHLEYDVDMEALQPTSVPAGTGAITIDWTDMLTTALGTEFIPNNITEALVAHYTQPITTLEDEFLDLELISQQMWRGQITSGTSANLSTFTNEAGQPFPGIDGTGTWILALICGGCRNPAPWYLTTLTTCSQ